MAGAFLTKKTHQGVQPDKPRPIVFGVRPKDVPFRETLLRLGWTSQGNPGSPRRSRSQWSLWLSSWSAVCITIVARRLSRMWFNQPNDYAARRLSPIALACRPIRGFLPDRRCGPGRCRVRRERSPVAAASCDRCLRLAMRWIFLPDPHGAKSSIFSCGAIGA